MKLEIREALATDRLAVIELFTTAFTVAEGQSEGEQLRKLTSELWDISGTSSASCFVVIQHDRTVGSVFTTRLSFDQDFHVEMLAPVAVDPAFQGKGYGQELIKHVIGKMAEQGVDMLVTYGDPAYYSKVGFLPVDESQIPAPMPLSMPMGWQAQTLNRNGFGQLSGPSCVKPFQEPAYW